MLAMHISIFHLPHPTKKNLPAFYDFSTFVFIKIHGNWKVPFPWSFPAPKGFANELKWIFCAAGFWFWSRFVLRLLTTQRFNKTQRFVLRLTTQHNTTFRSRYNSQRFVLKQTHRSPVNTGTVKSFAWPENNIIRRKIVYSDTFNGGNIVFEDKII